MKVMTAQSLYEVVDDYGKVWFAGSLMACGVWIDPIFGIDFDYSEWGEPGIDEDRYELLPDGSYRVEMYSDSHGLGMGGTMLVRPKVEA